MRHALHQCFPLLLLLLAQKQGTPSGGCEADLQSHLLTLLLYFRSPEFPCKSTRSRWIQLRSRHWQRSPADSVPQQLATLVYVQDQSSVSKALGECKLVETKYTFRPQQSSLGFSDFAQNQRRMIMPYKQRLIGLCSRGRPCDVACTSLLQPTLSLQGWSVADSNPYYTVPCL